MTTYCSDCYETSFQACYSHLNLDLGLTANTSYQIWIKDKFQNNKHIAVTSDASGNISVPIADFPEGWLVPSAGFFSLYVSTSTIENTRESFAIGYTDYDCVVFNLFENEEI